MTAPRVPAKESPRVAYSKDAIIDWKNFNQKISEYFTVGEVTNRDMRRIPRDLTVINNIYRLSTELDKIRKEWGKPIGVTSWYRPPAINREVDGAYNSQHLNGSAVDIYDMSGEDLKFEEFLDQDWGGGLGYGASSGLGFTHLDLREGSWKRGPGSLRWAY
jgi:putative chitinase